MLRNKTILVTGASHGLGKAFAKFCAKAGASVILLASNEKALEQCYDEIMALEGTAQPLICTFNLESATADEYASLRQHIEENISQLDGLAHFAGQLKSLTPIEQTPLQQWHRLMQINTNAKFALTQTLLPLLKSADKAHLIFALSDYAFNHGQAYWGTYQVSEHANKALYEILVQELEHSAVTVNAVVPSPAKTKLRKQAFPFEENPLLKDPTQLDDLWQKCFDDSTHHGQIIK